MLKVLKLSPLMCTKKYQMYLVYSIKCTKVFILIYSENYHFNTVNAMIYLKKLSKEFDYMAAKFYIDKVLSSAHYQKREAPWVHMPYEAELKMLNLIKGGGYVDELIDINTYFDERQHLSKGTLKQRKNELVALVTLATRWAVEGGLDVETAYDLSDAYILATDQTDNYETIITLIKEAPVHFASLVREKNRRENKLSKPVIQCIEYIEIHLHQQIAFSQLVEHVQKNPTYLSTLFKKETGLTVSLYIRKRKLEEAKVLLTDTSMTISQISYSLAFDTQSYFSAVFKDSFGETPGQYRSRILKKQ